jgi:hypothetical protein
LVQRKLLQKVAARRNRNRNVRCVDSWVFTLGGSRNWTSRKGTRRYAKEKAWIDSQIRVQWSGGRNWASGEALQTEEKEECTMKSVEALIPFQPEAAL